MKDAIEGLIVLN